MGGGHDQRTLGRERGERAVLSRRELRDMAQRIDDRIAGDFDPIGDPLAAEVVRRGVGGGEVPARHDARRAPIHLLREGELQAARAQAGLDVRNGDAMVERGECPAERAGGVALDHQRGGPRVGQDRADGGDDAAQDVVERLALAHELQVVIGTDPEQVEHRLNEVAVLPGRDDECRHIPGVQLGDHRGELDGLGSGAEEHADRAHG